MSSITIANLPRISREKLASTLLDSARTESIAIIDVRDSDHVGGHIKGSTWIPSSSLDYRIPELIRNMKDKDRVIFHCALSQQRGPSAALRYMRERERLLGKEQEDSSGQRPQEIAVLDGGFTQWQEKYGEDTRLTEGYAKDLWAEDAY